ncbi:energy-coupling factor transport system ATP-binding protein [Edaphobacillus lindanitolerans]|uniref:Energy-coupling factor transport system ATP-binding protein n=1 Tax=Edaphobacillus lindanitolerans TaxID=550447 RepID=A0A1U7PNB6_9BACI|nr:energy-coupling factor transport system ATP-binding protein [Edaphobacillus lindanitolerans]
MRPVSEPVLSLEKVSFRFPEDDRATLNEISFLVNSGERVVLSGPSGCGKSTLLYLLNRLYPANCDGIVSGSLELFGRPSDSWKPGEINRRIATVFQDPDAQFCMPTVEEELAFTLENIRIPRDEMESRITGVLELTGLEGFRNTVIQTLSGGQKQRVATACALIMHPDVLLLDEPLAHLDPHTALELVRWLDELQKQTGLTIVAVEHRLDLWNEFFDREICLGADGQLIGDRPFTPKPAIRFPERPSAIRSESAMSVESLSVRIKGQQIFAPLSFVLRAGEVAVLAGPNGSGKSSLAKALCGIYKTSGGKVHASGIGYVPQSPEFLFLTSSVRDELAFSGFASPNSIDDLTDRLRLGEIRNAHPFSVSHGQKRRVAIGAMLADNRPVIVMDEPTSGQDAGALLELFNLIEERRREGNTFLIITHDMEFAAAAADSVLLIKDGVFTGKYRAQEVWTDHALLAAHHLVPPKGANAHEPAFA